jgi:hypothetical protein
MVLLGVLYNQLISPAHPVSVTLPSVRVTHEPLPNDEYVSESAVEGVGRKRNAIARQPNCKTFFISFLRPSVADVVTREWPRLRNTNKAIALPRCANWSIAQQMERDTERAAAEAAQGISLERAFRRGEARTV